MEPLKYNGSSDFLNYMNIEITSLFDDDDLQTPAKEQVKRLHVNDTDHTQRIYDQFSGATCLLFRTEEKFVRLTVSGGYKFTAISAGGWLLIPASDALPTFWVPINPAYRKIDHQGHILHETPATIEGIDANASSLSVTLGKGDGVLDLVIWQLEDPALVQELTSLNTLESQSWFLWGSHTIYRRPADLYLHLIHGCVYENRASWPFYWKICSENDAHALYVTLTGLLRATGKRIYELLRSQLMLCVIGRLGTDGAFRHGEWTDSMEAHYRLHASGMHLMMDYLSEHDDANVRAALSQAAMFIASRSDQTEMGSWFLHDDLEISSESMAKSPFSWKPGRALGKNTSNMLVLNTHLDTLIALDRARTLCAGVGDETLIHSAVIAANSILQLRPAQTLYKFASKILYLTFLPEKQAAQLPVYLRALKRIGWKWLAPRFHHLKTARPRLVMPGGYIDRALSLKGVSDAYQSINVMDLLRFLRRFPGEQTENITREALFFTHSSGLLDQWAQTPKKQYALGFWAEALWHACSLYPDVSYRVWLAQAMLRLETTDMGLPPSLMGSNAEAIPNSEQVPCPITLDSRLRIANLSRGTRWELLIVNPTDTDINLQWEHAPDVLLPWQNAKGQTLTQSPVVLAGSWIHGQSE